MLTNPITGKILKGATNNKFLLEVVNNWFPNKYICKHTDLKISPNYKWKATKLKKERC
jgi:hypothetical protein